MKLTTSLTQSEANEQRTLHRWAQATRQHFTTKTAHQTDQFRVVCPQNKLKSLTLTADKKVVTILTHPKTQPSVTEATVHYTTIGENVGLLISSKTTPAT